MRLLVISKLFLGFLVVSNVSGCGGGSSGSSAASYSELSSSGINLITRLNQMPATSEAAMPTGGSAVYDGVVAYSFSSFDPVQIAQNPDTLSNLELRANFGSGTVSGSATNFRSAYGIDIDGALNISNGAIRGSEFAADLGGTLREDGVNVTYNGELAGGFLGESANAVAGGGAANAFVDGMYIGTGYAVFGAER